MMTQETYVNINDLHKQGWTISEIAEKTGWHRATISDRLKNGPPPTQRPTEPSVMTELWRTRIGSMLEAHPRLLSVSIHNRLSAEGFGGSYPTVVRAVRDVRGPRFKAANAVSVPIHTSPGEEAQFDFCDLSSWAVRFGWNIPLVAFGMILSWSRFRIWWFTTSEDRHHTFEGMARFFDEIGGVPAACRTDRMGALGRSQGRRFELHPPTVGFAAHHSTKITSCQAGDAKRKGKVERPFRQLQETFLPEVEADGVPVDLADLNLRGQVWLAERVHGVESRSTGERPAARLKVERDFLVAVAEGPVRLGLRRDPAGSQCVAVRRDRREPLLGAPRSVGPQGRDPPTSRHRHREIRLAGRLIATHRLVGGRRVDVWDPAHKHAAETLALGWDPAAPTYVLFRASRNQNPSSASI